MPTTPIAVFAVDLDLLQQLELAFGPPIDSYLRGWQVWIEPTDAADPDAIELEYRLHPPGGFAQPEGYDHHALWDDVVVQSADRPDVFLLGGEERPLESLWTLLEVFPAYGDECTHEQVRAWSEARLGRPALASGDVDHGRLGGTFEKRGPEFDLPAALREALGV